MKTLTFTFIFCFLSFFSFSQNSALSFDGAEEYLTVPESSNFDIGNAFTIEAWIFAESWTDASWQGSIVTRDGQGPDRGFAFRCGDNGTLSFVMSVDNTWEEATSSQVMNTNQWHHVATVINNGTITLYIDGQPSGNASFSGTHSAGNGLDLHIGSSAGFGGRFFDGVLDEVRVWTDARTAAEIADNATVDLTGSEDNLALYLPMNEGSGTTAGDLTANNATAGFNQMDESNWVDGYTLPDNDISVQAVYGVDVINMIDRPVKLKVDLQNTGLQESTNIELTIRIDDEVYNTETVDASIPAGELYAYEFEVPVDFIGMDNPEVTVEAVMANDGNALNNIGDLTLITGSGNDVIIADQSFFNNGQLNNSIKMTLPNDLHRYEQMLLNIDLSCPSGGCGDWDVLADLQAVTDAGTFELARYITPYGIACGGWVVDITDFKSVLGGEVEFQTTIFVYTPNGWLLDMSVDLIDNNSQNTHSKITKLWEESYHVYGDPGIEDDLPGIDVTVDNNTETSHVRMTNSGHGQGNTNNAAEFFEVTHNLNVNGSPFADHHLWKDDCASNPCDNQAGSWLFPRAGWCPGQAVDPFVINTTSAATAGSTVELDYELQDYTNLLNTGYNNSGHTEPYYKIYSYFVEESSTPFEDYQNLAITNVSANTNGGVIENVTVSITNDGLEDLSGFELKIFYDNALIAEESFSDALAVGASIDKTITLSQSTTTSDALFAEVVNDMDDNPGDNVIKGAVTTSTKKLDASYPFEVFPNPTTDGTLSLQYDKHWNESILNIYHANGVLAQSVLLNDKTTQILLQHEGIYIYTLVHPEQGQTSTGKIVFTK